jgi:hypothetical protein
MANLSKKQILSAIVTTWKEKYPSVQVPYIGRKLKRDAEVMLKELIASKGIRITAKQ